jgi:hypothetical protein
MDFGLPSGGGTRKCPVCIYDLDFDNVEFHSESYEPRSIRVSPCDLDALS